MRQYRYYNLVMFDPGGVTGWAAFQIHLKAFMERDATVLDNIKWWSTGELDEKEHWQITSAANLVQKALYNEDPFSITEAVAEDFELMQTVGGNDLLIPVRFNAVLEWELSRRFGMKLQTQKRTLRTGVTRDRLRRMGLHWKGKDSFAAMQHAITWLRREKDISRRNPKIWLRSKLPTPARQLKKVR